MRHLKTTAYIFTGIMVIWTVLTFWVQYSGEQQVSFVGDSSASKKALVVYNPDPIYNLDEQVCKAFALGLSLQGFYVKIATIKAATEEDKPYDCFAFCANTYNWAPDWSTNNYIANHPNLSNQNVVAITLGSGSTSRAKRILEETIVAKNANLLMSETYWLMRPNDENRMEEKNTKIAFEFANELGHQAGVIINK